MSKIGVIIPVYNAEKTISRCLDSLLAQNHTDWQAIMVDDDSSDLSGEIIDGYCKRDERFVYIRQEKNCGAAGARNRALDLLDAPYVAFLDSDDFWESDMLDVMVHKAEETDADVVQCRFIYDFENGESYAPQGAFDKETFLEKKGLRKVYLKMMTGINMNHVCIKLMKTSLVKDLRFDTALKTAEDLEFCIRLFQRVKRYVFIPAPMYHYYRSGVSITGSSLSGKEKLKANILVSRVMTDALKAWDMDNIFYRTLCRVRPYLIIVSKIYRTAREKIMTTRGNKA